MDTSLQPLSLWKVLEVEDRTNAQYVKQDDKTKFGNIVRSTFNAAFATEQADFETV